MRKQRWLIKIQGAELNMRAGEIEPANHLLCPRTHTNAK